MNAPIQYAIANAAMTAIPATKNTMKRRTIERSAISEGSVGTGGGAIPRLYTRALMSTTLSESSTGPLRAAIVAVQLPDADDEAFAASVAELHRLGRTLGVEVVATLTQRRPSLHAGR